MGASKAELSLKYRLGLEHALAKADFMNMPNLVLVQALAIFLCLARRDDSPLFIWMMTGVVVRMAQHLGLQRDPAYFEGLSPFEMEMRRRIWWAVYMLDSRSSDDQGTEMTILSGSFDTKMSLNINIADLTPESKEMPPERTGVTDMSFARIFIGLADVLKQLFSSAGVANLNDQSHLINQIYQKFDRGYLQYTSETGNMVYWVGVTLARLVMAKMALIVFLPVLFTSSNENLSDEIRTKLLVSAIEVAEYNHAMCDEQACRHWHWLFQTCTHWHAIVYIMIEISRRSWSPIVERAWVALHSKWLIPAQKIVNNNLRIWVPLRKLMGKVRRHRDAELNRLRADPSAAARLEMEDQKIQLPSSPPLLPSSSNANVFLDRWHQLLTASNGNGNNIYLSKSPSSELASSTPMTLSSQATPDFQSTYFQDSSSMHISSREQQASYMSTSIDSGNFGLSVMAEAPSEPVMKQPTEPQYSSYSTAFAGKLDARAFGPGSGAWLWADADPSVDVFANFSMDPVDTDMDLNMELDWSDWIVNAKTVEREGGHSQTSLF